jgi:preprotein translocase subunit SecA
MLQTILRKIFGTKHDREMKRMRPLVAAINALEPKIKKMSSEEMRARTAAFKEQLDAGASLDDFLIEAFALVREASVRTLGLRHFDVQLVGGVVLHKGRIAEMKTGEGKTLVATLALYLNALPGKGVHLVTVNDYLARRDAEWMGPIFNLLGMNVGVVIHQQSDMEKRRAYLADITYGQNNEFGFDYLRDNMKFSAFECMQRPLFYAIVDEVDSILVDEARTPLIISGAAEESTDLYRRVNEMIPKMKRDVHYTVDEAHRHTLLTDEGVSTSERFLGLTNLFDPDNIEYIHHINQALKAHTLFKRDRDYMVSDSGQILIIDEDTGRVLPGRRWSDGLHQAVEAKEHVPVQEENRTLATISFQNYFRLYDKLAGMTGTADTEAAEFKKIYDLDVTVIPTNKPMIRTDHQDVVYKTEREKFSKIVDEILDCHTRGQPVLVGTVSVEKSEAISRILARKKISHNVLNAKQHEREAYTIAQAGRKGSVTVATNMAGRGTDIVLGGNPEMIAKMKINEGDPPERYKELVEEFRKIQTEEREIVIREGGVHILGTERHESRRIDNQLRGRSGRQGDPGSSRFYLSLEDDLLRIFGADKITGIMDRLGMEEGVPIEHGMVTKSIQNAQKKVEERNFEIRKSLLEYDDVMNQQRKTIYSLRRQILEGRYEPISLIEEEEEKKKAKRGKKSKAPTARGPIQPAAEVDEKLAAQIHPIVEMMIRHHPDALKARGEVKDEVPQDGEAEEGENLADLDDVISIKPRAVELEVYHYFGTYTDLTKLRDKPREAIDFITACVCNSLGMQKERLLDVAENLVADVVAEYTTSLGDHAEKWNLPGLRDEIKSRFALDIEDIEAQARGVEALQDYVFNAVEDLIDLKEDELSFPLFMRVFRYYFLEEIDRQWIDHLQNVDYLRQGIGLRGYAHKDPKQEYKKEGYYMFQEMMGQIEQNVVKKLFRVKLKKREDALLLGQRRRRRSTVEGRGGEIGDTAQKTKEKPGVSGTGAKTMVGRNDPCPCGSGKKYKKCCMVKDGAAAS